MTIAWRKNILYECVACVCLTFATIFLLIAFFMAIGFLLGVMTVSFALPTDLYNFFGLQKCLVYKDFILKDTKILLYIPWPSGKQSANFISSKSNLV